MRLPPSLKSGVIEGQLSGDEMAEQELLYHRWDWYWRVDEKGEADCGICAQVRPGHAYAVVRCPRYMQRRQWEEYASYICGMHNAKFHAYPVNTHKR